MEQKETVIRKITIDELRALDAAAASELEELTDEVLEIETDGAGRYSARCRDEGDDEFVTQRGPDTGGEWLEF